ncbi:WLM domain-containing protein [Coniochaeta sp. 2T2.1]|nr:WLM domain-containing protein [Coniochaeta sp. 2T2.1]
MADTEPTQPQDPSASQHEDHHVAEEDLPIKITIKFAPENYNSPVSFAQDATLDELTEHCYRLAPDYDWSNAKFLLSSRPPPGAPKPPRSLLHASQDGLAPLLPFHSTTLKLLAQKDTAIADLKSESEKAARREQILAARKTRINKQQHHHSHNARPQPRGPHAQEDAAFTFHTLQPLQNLPNPRRSLEFLQRLKDDAGIRAAMRKHKFSVGLLTEMDPAAYTESNHEGTTRILGLNRNQGEVIELRLRTDAGDGYRDYKTIRKTLCHELAHNIHGPHDRNFWDLCHQIEREVAANDYRSGGRTVADGEFAPERPGQEEEEEEFMDHGAWTGGSYVLGGSTTVSGQQMQPMGRREILARAAEARRRDMQDAHIPKDKGTGGGGSSRSGDGQGST